MDTRFSRDEAKAQKKVQVTYSIPKVTEQQVVPAKKSKTDGNKSSPTSREAQQESFREREIGRSINNIPENQTLNQYLFQ